MFEFLDEPIPITSQQWREGTIPLVSISCITYNHENYIRNAIEGFLMQKTTFPVEILIHDDASTDKTAEIVREYEKKYPQLIKPIYQTENQYSKNNASIGRIQRERAVGKYYATCEGDDYWIDPLKLQKQVDFMESNTEYSMCFHNAFVLKGNSNEMKLFASLEDREYTPNEILVNWLVPTASVLFRKEYLNNKIYDKNYIFTDIALFLTLCEYGKVRCLNETMAIYRRHETGLTQNKYKLKQRIVHFNTLNKNFNYKYDKEIKKIKKLLYISSIKNIIKKFLINLKIFK